MCCLFAYGSIVNSQYSNEYKSGLDCAPFIETEVRIPVSLGRLSSRRDPRKSRITLVPDKEGVLVPLFFSATQLSLEEAKTALKKREGMVSDKNLLVISVKSNAYHPAIDQKNIKKIKKWLKDHGFKHGLITVFPPNKLPTTLDRAVHRRSLEYFNKLPEPTKKALVPQAEQLGYFTKPKETNLFKRIF